MINLAIDGVSIADTAENIVYTAPATRILSFLSICNTSTGTVNISVKINGFFVTQGKDLLANETFVFDSERIVLNLNDTVSVQIDVGTVDVIVNTLDWQTGL